MSISFTRVVRVWLSQSSSKDLPRQCCFCDDAEDDVPVLSIKVILPLTHLLVL